MNFAFIKRLLKNLSWPPAPRKGRAILGATGERAAASALKRRGHRIIARNFRCPTGELDLVTADGPVVVFVEVKTRSDEQHQDPFEAVGTEKWSRVERAARYYASHRGWQQRPMRFDLVTVIQRENGTPRIEHVEDAYQPRRP